MKASTYLHKSWMSFYLHMYIWYCSIITSFLHAWQHNKTLNNPVMCLRGPRFLVGMFSCILSCAMHGIVACGIASRGTCISGMATHMIAMHGTHVGTDYLTCRIQSTIVKEPHIVHSNSHINYQGNAYTYTELF